MTGKGVASWIPFAEQGRGSEDVGLDTTQDAFLELRELGCQQVSESDDITMWTTEGRLGNMEDRHQPAASIVEAYASDLRLQCAPTKSEHMHVGTRRCV